MTFKILTMIMAIMIQRVHSTRTTMHRIVCSGTTSARTPSMKYLLDMIKATELRTVTNVE